PQRLANFLEGTVVRGFRPDRGNAAVEQPARQ
ncbi:MAG: hypothetical protein QG655_3846, partial [Actinomycetota bacterium]|nr:hypothetical protein [Actinomycetota bacterium]